MLKSPEFEQCSIFAFDCGESGDNNLMILIPEFVSSSLVILVDKEISFKTVIVFGSHCCFSRLKIKINQCVSTVEFIFHILAVSLIG